MSDVVPAGSSSVPAPIDDDLMVGLEDLKSTDLTIPRLNLKHAEGVFVDNLDGRVYSELDVIVLGMVRQRTLWDTDVDEDKFPLCRSLDFDHGLPGESFPWAKTPFEKADNAVLDCASCPLKDWGSHPTRADSPWCSEVFVLPVLLEVGEGKFAPALTQFQRSGAKPVKNYLQSFAREGKPTFTTRTHISLETKKRGTVTYSTPIFTKGDDTDPTHWPYFATQLREIRSFIRTPRNRDETEVETAPPPPAPTTSEEDDGDLPF